MFSIWMQGADAAPPDVAATFRANADLAARDGWTFDVLDARGLREAARAAGVLQKYDAYEHMHQRIDLGRLCELWARGGVSIDADQRLVRGPEALPHLRGNKVVVSELVCSTHSALCHRAMTLGTASRSLNNALIICPARAPAMLTILRRLARRRRDSTGSAFADVQATTGPIAFSRVVADLVDRGEVLAMPARIVEPCSTRASSIAAILGGTARADGCEPYPDTVAVHAYSATWMRGLFNAVCTALAASLAAWMLWAAARRRSRLQGPAP